jgi:hypothetical protein
VRADDEESLVDGEPLELSVERHEPPGRRRLERVAGSGSGLGPRRDEREEEKEEDENGSSHPDCEV